VVSSLDLDIGEETVKVTSGRNGYQLPSFATGLACEGDTPSTACAPIALAALALHEIGFDAIARQARHATDALAHCLWSEQPDHIITNTYCWLPPPPAEHDVHLKHACIAGPDFVLERKDT
jgi:hypothetical protein